jgi:hypothetical protein
MDLGTIVFYRNYGVFTDTLTHMKVQEKALNTPDELFQEHYGYHRQALFHILYQSPDMWGFVAKPINKRDGSIEYKVVNSDGNIKTVKDSDIYFALKMDDYSYTHWVEMKGETAVAKSVGKKMITKKPSSSCIKKAKRGKMVFGLGANILFQMATLTKGSPQYPLSNPFNNDWKEYDPYYPTKETFASYGGFYKDMRDYNPQAQQPNWDNLWKSKQTTLHAIPFLRDNISPTTFSVVRQIKAAENDMRMFINFRKGIPITL